MILESVFKFHTFLFLLNYLLDLEMNNNLLTKELKLILSFI